MNPASTRIRRRARRAALAHTNAWRRRVKRRCAPTGKTRFPDLDTAIAAALRLSNRLGRGVRPYPCDHCEGWHLTRRTTWTPKETP